MENARAILDSSVAKTSALTSFADEVLLHMESGELCGAVFLDPVSYTHLTLPTIYSV